MRGSLSDGRSMLFRTRTPGGPTYVGETAGTISFTSGADAAALGSMTYGPVVAGFGEGEGYPQLLINPTTWSPGDLLSVSAQGAEGHVPAFAVSVRGVGLPSFPTPGAITRSAALDFSWTPDPNATTTMTLTLAAYANGTNGTLRGTVVCTGADSAGAFSVDSSLLASFASGDQCWGSLERSASTSVELTGGRVTFTAKADQSFLAPIK
jgi:hypothetical protein